MILLEDRMLGVRATTGVELLLMRTRTQDYVP